MPRKKKLGELLGSPRASINRPNAPRSFQPITRQADEYVRRTTPKRRPTKRTRSY